MPTAKSKSPNMSEKDLLNDLLNQEKMLLAGYSASITESSCPNLRNVLTKNFTDTSKDQFEVFQHMNQKGYYAIKDAPSQDVTNAQQKCMQMRNEIR